MYIGFCSYFFFSGVESCEYLANLCFSYISCAVFRFLAYFCLFGTFLYRACAIFGDVTSFSISCGALAYFPRFFILLTILVSIVSYCALIGLYYCLCSLLLSASCCMLSHIDASTCCLPSCDIAVSLF